ncbi:hypothetical protein [Caulobacter vibrioides]|uniref:hypothetical protein n=1 Tax=Caulobacter vibrioides TaxID=155892 RepID=UPI0015E64A86|nr:hypothetical protein [Caulobacter vibrioides]
MASTLHTLKTYYSNIMRADFARIPTQHQTLLNTLSAQVDSGALSAASAQSLIAKLAIESTSVASLSYSFFTGGTPSSVGFDYLISPTGPNPNNLNSSYYATFNVENRFINFAMNLGKVGEGATWFTANYGDMTTRQALIKAYTEIFATVPSDAKVDALLGDQVSNGQGGTFSRQAYFAAFSNDGLEGLGTKAAIVGWLLSVATKEGLGPYAAANDAFLADLGPDGVALFRSGLLTAYGPAAPAGVAGEALTVAGDKSVSPTASDAALKSTANNDTLTVTGDIAGGVTIDAGAGRDTVKVTLGTFGKITTSDGGDALTLGHLLSTTATLGVPAQYGTVALGANNNVVTLKGSMAVGTSLTAAGTNNVLHVDRTGAVDATFYDGAISGFQTVYYHSSRTASVSGASVLYSVVDNAADKGSVNFNLNNNEVVVLKDTPNAAVVTTTAVANGQAKVDIHLQAFKGAPTTVASPTMGGGFSVDGGSIGLGIYAGGGASNQNGTLVLHVDSDSTAGLIYGWSTSLAAPTFRDALPNLTIVGAGKLTAQIYNTFSNVDASQAGDLSLTYAIGVSATAQTLRLSDGTNDLKLVFTAPSGSLNFTPAVSKVYLGAGADTVSLASSLLAGRTELTSLSNLFIKDGTALGAPPEIVGFQKGFDHLVLDGMVRAVTANVQVQADGKASLQDALIAVSAQVSANTAAVFTFNGDTYVYAQDSVVGVNLGDGLIKLVGVTGLTVGTGAGSYDVHYG